MAPNTSDNPDRGGKPAAGSAGASASQAPQAAPPGQVALTLADPSKPKSDEETLVGTIERIVFHNPDNQWTVARFTASDDAEMTVVGALPGVAPGAPVRVAGRWVVDQRFGKQFRVETYQVQTPNTIDGLERYLGSGLIRGLGPQLAKRVVERFGFETLTVLNDAPERLREVDGIGTATCARIRESWSSHRALQDVMVFLHGHGVTASQARRIFKKYGNETIAIVRQNPYRLAIDVWGIGFRSADQIARKLDIAENAPERVEAGLIHVLGEAAERGHVHVPVLYVFDKARELLSLGVEYIQPGFDRLVLGGLIVREELHTQCASLRTLWDCERATAQSLATLLATPMKPLSLDIETAIAQFEREAGIAMAEQQKRALLAVGARKCVVITGGPGVGKTTVVRAIMRCLRAAGREVALAAPTGRAAKRLSEATGGDAVTLHRLLEYQPHQNAFGRNREKPIEADTVIIDETSMVDIQLMRTLTEALDLNTQLIFVGDIDQLPSVGPGAVLADLVSSGVVTVITLDEVFRQAAESHIITNAHKINQGVIPELAPPKGDDPRRSDFYFISRPEPIDARAMVVDMVTRRIPKAFGFDPLRDVQVLCPMHRGELGTIALNRELQASLNPLAPGTADKVKTMKRGEVVFRPGDKVMQIRNDYDKGVFNGDIGVIDAIAKVDDVMTMSVAFLDGREAGYTGEDLDQLTHAYAISVHKSQGSEYPVVVVPLVTQHYMMLQRNLLYTAVTRGKQLVVIVGADKAVTMAVRNDDSEARWTWLGQRIREAMTG